MAARVETRKNGSRASRSLGEFRHGELRHEVRLDKHGDEEMTTALERREIDCAGLRVLLEGPSEPDELVRSAVRRGAREPDFWAHLWPSSLALAEHLAVSGLIGPGLRVLEVGCGLGLAGIVAAMRGAEVTLTDQSPAAVEQAGRNARLNGVRCECRVFDWRDEPDPAWSPGLVLAADVLYAAAHHLPLARLIARLGCPAMLADPSRPASAGFEPALQEAGLRSWSAPARSGRILMVSAE